MEHDFHSIDTQQCLAYANISITIFRIYNIIASIL